MDAEQELREIKRVVTDLSCSEAKLESAVLKLGTLLYNSPQSSLRHLQQQTFQMGIVKALLGILRSSNSPDLGAKVAGCVALLAHGNDTGRTSLGEMGVIPLLVHLLSPNSVNGSVPCWHSDWVPAYEQALVALRKLTYHNENNQQELAVIGGLKLITEISTSRDLLTNFQVFTPEAKDALEALVLNKTLASRVETATGASKSPILCRFNALNQRDSAVATHYPAFIISLVGTDGLSISDLLLEKGVVWPDHTQPGSDCKLTRVHVACVEDGGHLWCQFVSDQQREGLVTMTESLRKMPPLKSATLPRPLITPGDVYAAYLDDSLLPDGHFLQLPQWIRVRLLSLEETKDEMLSNKAWVLAVDYGFTVILSTTHLKALPPDCRGIPPQAIPCRLRGVQPPPASLAILENASAVLRNVAFELLSFRKEIVNFGGTEALLSLSRCPHKPAVVQALMALLNMAVSSELREEMGTRGAIHSLLDMCRQHSVLDDEILQHTVSCLYNLVIGCHSNITLLKNEGGGEVLSDLLSKRQLAPREHHCLVRMIQDLSPRRSQPVGVVNTGPSHRKSRQDSLEQLRRRVNQERTPSKPVKHVLESDDSECECEPVVTCEADARVELNDKEEECESSGAVSQAKTYNIGRQLPDCTEENNRHSFIALDSIEELPASLMRRTVCAFANTGKQCRVHIGVGKMGVVSGVKVQRKERDQLVVAIDNLMASFTPKIHHNQYSVFFVPVMGRGQRLLDDVFVVEVTVKEAAFHQVYTVRERNKQKDMYDRCYYRIGPFNEQLSFQELRDIVTQEEGGKYEVEISALEKNIQRLKTAMETAGH